MHVDVVAVLVVFCIAFTVSQQEINGFGHRHGRRHRQEEKYAIQSGSHNHKGGGGGGDGGRKFNKRNNNLYHHPSARHNSNNNNNNNNNNNMDVELGLCCPTVEEPSGTKLYYAVTKSNKFVEVNNDEQSPQVFFEVQCAPNVENKTCNYVERNKRKYSVCVQRYSYTYALVKDLDSAKDDWRLDHIRIKNGCTCELRINR